MTDTQPTNYTRTFTPTSYYSDKVNERLKKAHDTAVAMCVKYNYDIITDFYPVYTGVLISMLAAEVERV
jgi:hypothetical protein